jgi:uncharacterized membrane protein YdjX (TVP38/TMEM64 family)
VLVLIVLVGLGRWAGVADLNLELVNGYVRAAGAWGWLLYLALFAGGVLLHIPGMVFVVAGIVAYGQVLGFVLAFTGSVGAVISSFVVVRMVGGQPLGGVQNPWLQRMLSHLHDRPIRTVCLLRLVMWLAPPLNYALAMTNLTFRDYLIGSVAGLVIPVAGVAVLIEWIVK